ncbi:hypothetical protein ABPG75_008274 [Micractinium tetrahymenae]
MAAAINTLQRPSISACPLPARALLHGSLLAQPCGGDGSGALPLATTLCSLLPLCHPVVPLLSPSAVALAAHVSFELGYKFVHGRCLDERGAFTSPHVVLPPLPDAAALRCLNALPPGASPSHPPTPLPSPSLSLD